jgi:hypothetical protein
MASDLHEPVDQAVWENFIEESPGGMLFHKWDFLKVTEKYTNHKLLPLAVFDHQKIICLLPLFCRNIYGFKVILSPPPRTCTPYLGPVMLPEFYRLSQTMREEYAKKAVNGLINAITSFSPHYISITCVPGFSDMRPFKWGQFHIDSLYTYEIDLRRPLTEIWDNVQPRTRKYIRKYIDRITLRQVRTKKDLKLFFAAEVDRYKSQGLVPPLISASYLEDLSRVFDKNIRLYLIEDMVNGDLLGIWSVVLYKGRYITWVGGVRPSHDSAIQHVNEATYWLTMKSAKEEGCCTYVMEGANTPRLCLFKSKFNPRLVSYFRAYKSSALGSIGEWFYRMVHKRRFW